MNAQPADGAPLPSNAAVPLGRPDDQPVGFSPFPIVGIGASAGGLEAFTQLLSALPERTGMALILVQHLDPRHESRLSDLLQRTTSIAITEVTDGLAVQPGNIYIIPPNTSLAIARGVLHLSPREEARRPHLPIDHFFRSLAADQQSRAVGVVLSGTGSDGTQGLCEIKSVGGITFAQSEATAGHGGMPRSAIESGCVDFVLAPDAIARRLDEIGEHPYLASEPTPVTRSTDEESFHQILTSVRAVAGVDFSLYRDSTLKRRIMRRMALHDQHDLREYAAMLKQDRNEAEALYHDLLINVTSFFRDPEMFAALHTSVFPAITRGKSPSEPVRIWVPGCSTGQEAFSLAMALMEYFDDRPVRQPVQIFGTDLSDQTALERARSGVFPESIESEVSPERLRRFFRREDHVYRIDKTIRDLCLFARQNVAADPPFSHLDLISCRNVLIYLTPPLQKRILSTFHYALNPAGYLLLGPAETVGEASDLFEIKDRTHRIYARKAAPLRQHHLPQVDLRSSAAFLQRQPAPVRPGSQDFQKEVDRVLLNRYAPPGVLVDENFDILQFRGRTSQYLEPPSGEPTTNVLRLAREGLFLELRNLMAEARKQKQTVRREGVPLRLEGGIREITLEVIPVRVTGGDDCYLILFHEAGAPEGKSKPAEPLPSSKPEMATEVVHLRQELAATREYLQALSEQQDAAYEELRSAHEEIVSSNEELQSTNEELETAKEELQSANEELTTVNEQLNRRNQELDLANNDLTNLFASTNIPVVMLSRDLRIRRFTSPARKILGLLPTDVGRPISDLNLSPMVPEVETLIASVLEQMQSVEREVQDREGRWYALRIHPYRTEDNRIDGVVLAFVNVEVVHRTREELQRQGSMIEVSQDGIIVRDARDLVVSWNRGAQEMYGWSVEEARGKPLQGLLGTDPAIWQSLNLELERQGSWEGELTHIRRDGIPVLVLSREVLIRDRAGGRIAVLSIARDITQARREMAALTVADHRKDEFLALLAHELRNPLAPARNAIEIMQRSMDDPEALAKARDVLDRQVRQLTRIVEDLVDVTRIAERKLELRRQRVALSTLVEMALETCRPLVEAAGQKLTVVLPPEPLTLSADPVRLSQVLVNLLTNASKFSEPGADMRLSAERVPADRPAPGGDRTADVMIRVGDHGIGIPAEFLPRVFDMFSQQSTAPERRWGGLGVGLALVRSLVQLHGGTVEVQSDGPGKGTEFRVRLPLVEGTPETPGPTAAGPPAANTPSRRILVVDDNPDQAGSLSALLQLMGHQVLVAQSGPQALEALRSFTPEVALVDIGLPGMNGYELARRIRETPQGKTVTLVAQTGWGQTEDRRHSQEAGFDHHLVKPIEPEAIQEILSKPV